MSASRRRILHSSVDWREMKSCGGPRGASGPSPSFCRRRDRVGIVRNIVAVPIAFPLPFVIAVVLKVPLVALIPELIERGQVQTAIASLPRPPDTDCCLSRCMSDCLGRRSCICSPRVGLDRCWSGDCSGPYSAIVTRSIATCLAMV